MIRPFERADAAGVAALLRVVEPAWVFSAEGFGHWVESQPENARFRAWVALEGEDVVGWGDARFLWEFGGEPAGLFVGVRPERRGHGLGSRLYELAEAHVASAPRVYVEATGEESARRFLLARGFREERADRLSVLDPRTVDPSRLAELEKVKARQGFRAVELGAVRDRGPELHRLLEAVQEDIPSSEPLVSIGYEDFKRIVLAQPDLDDEVSVVVLAPDGRAVALSWLHVDREGGRAMVEMTGTLPEFRRRGLARFAKLATIRRAAELGIDAMYTGNDTENRAMLALNDELGFEPRVIQQSFVKESR